jgi:hypothetical protein
MGKRFASAKWETRHAVAWFDREYCPSHRTGLQSLLKDTPDQNREVTNRWL